jgi:hypothetical protein
VWVGVLLLCVLVCTVLFVQCFCIVYAYLLSFVLSVVVLGLLARRGNSIAVSNNISNNTNTIIHSEVCLKTFP